MIPDRINRAFTSMEGTCISFANSPQQILKTSSNGQKSINQTSNNLQLMKEISLQKISSSTLNLDLQDHRILSVQNVNKHKRPEYFYNRSKSSTTTAKSF